MGAASVRNDMQKVQIENNDFSRIVYKSVTIRVSNEGSQASDYTHIFRILEPNVPQITSCKELPHDCERREVHKILSEGANDRAKRPYL